MENHHFNGNIHYNWPFSIAMLNYQRVMNSHGFFRFCEFIGHYQAVRPNDMGQ